MCVCAVRVIVSLLFVSDINESDLSECELLSTVAVSNHSSESRVCVCVCVCVGGGSGGRGGGGEIGGGGGE